MAARPTPSQAETTSCHPKLRAVATCIALGLLWGSLPARASDGPGRTPPWPYPPGSTYLGIHGNRENNDRVFSPGPRRFTKAWSALRRHIVPQPVTFSPDGSVLYATSARSEGGMVCAVDTEEGRTLWCREDLLVGVTASSVEVDVEGNLYVTDGDESRGRVLCLHPEDGRTLWEVRVEALGGVAGATFRAPVGLHFTPGGHVVTQTAEGVIVLLAREDGRILDTLDIPAVTGFVAPPRRDTSRLVQVLPKAVRDKIETLYGPLDDDLLAAFLGGLLGASGAFTDNTVAVSANNQVFAVGGGPDPLTGALVAVDITQKRPSGTPSLRFRWAVPLDAGSAASPAVTPDGSRLAVGDGTGSILYVDVEACNENHDSDPDPARGAPKWMHPLEGAHIAGSVGIDEDGTVYFWDTSSDPRAPDLIALSDGSKGPVPLWRRSFAPPGSHRNRNWSSVVTVADNLIFGTVTTELDRNVRRVSGIPLIRRMRHEVVAVERKTGRLVWHQPIADDSSATVGLGPDGGLCVAVLGVLDLLSPRVETGVEGGVVKYAPVRTGRPPGVRSAP